MTIKVTKYFIVSLAIIFLNLFNVVFGQNHNDTIFYTVEATLIEAQPFPAHCGMFTFSIAQEFKIVESNMQYFPRDGKIIVVVECPEFLGYNFFKPGAPYKIIVYQKINTKDSVIINTGLIKMGSSIYYTFHIEESIKYKYLK